VQRSAYAREELPEGPGTVIVFDPLDEEVVVAEFVQDGLAQKRLAVTFEMSKGDLDAGDAPTHRTAPA
jgi:hypothetical protein